MGAIFEAIDTRTGQEVALKVMLEAWLGREDLLERFAREGDAIQTLRHPHVVEYYGHGTDDQGRPFLVTELLRGSPGHKLLRREPMLTLREVVGVIKQLCAALTVAHSRGIVHRDLKWANVMVTPVPGDPLYLKLLDFGILKYADDGSKRKRLTVAGTLLGTPEYVSPEQIMGLALDGRSDLYSVGVMAYELLCGRRPFVAKHRADLLIMHIREPVPPMSEVGLRYELPPGFEAAVLRALEKKPDDRFQSVAYLARALDASLKASEGAYVDPDDEHAESGVFSYMKKKE